MCPLESRGAIKLTPVQQISADQIHDALASSGVVVLKSDPGFGRTLVLRNVWATTGGAFIGMGEFAASLKGKGQIEETLLDLMQAAISRESTVFLDDLHMLTQVTDASDYPRENLIDIVFSAIISRAEALGTKIVIGNGKGHLPLPVHTRAVVCSMEDFAKEDYLAIGMNLLGAEASKSLDFGRVYRYAPALSVHQLKSGLAWLRCQKVFGTEALIGYLTEHNMASNVDLEEVTPVTWTDLKGMDDVIRSLETKIALPLENDALAAELELKPKRGVLLAGPPGTGKTTIGRALAHRLQSKFFLIDGTMIAGSSDFYEEIKQVFAAARKNAPAIIFIDDGDVIFEQNRERGLYRFLLTMLDGLESASAERVCVMMTAMDPGCVPPAMLRSGRIELWLETRLPDEAARFDILAEKLARLPEPIRAADTARIAAESRGLTGADLKAVIEDGKLLYAHDKVTGNELKSIDEYFLEAIRTVRANHRSYSRAKPSRTGEARQIGFVQD